MAENVSDRVVALSLFGMSTVILRQARRGSCRVTSSSRKNYDAMIGQLAHGFQHCRPGPGAKSAISILRLLSGIAPEERTRSPQSSRPDRSPLASLHPSCSSCPKGQLPSSDRRMELWLGQD